MGASLGLQLCPCCPLRSATSGTGRAYCHLGVPTVLPIPSRTAREAELEEGCSTRSLLHQPQWEGQDHPEDAGPPPARRRQPTREAPASAALPRTHLDTPPGKFRVLLLKLRDELIIVHLRTHARHALPGAASGQGAGRPARVSVEPLALAGAPCQRPQPIQHFPPLGTNGRQETESELWVLLCESGQADLLASLTVIICEMGQCSLSGTYLLGGHSTTPVSGEYAGGRAWTQA